MDRIRTATAYLFFVNAILHIGTVLFTAFTAISLGVLLFGVAFAVFGYLVLRGGRGPLLAGGLVTLVGLLINILLLVTSYSPVLVIFLALDLATIAGCVFLLKRSRVPYRTA